ncbi:MAG: phosphatidate cytidylyltransferase, partial [Gaiellales bacterium]
MSAFFTRLAVTLVGLPIVLGAAWLGGWVMLTLIALAVVVALHELFRATRHLRPLTLAGFTGGLVTLLALQLGGTAWLPLGAGVALVMAFVMAVMADTSQSNTVAVSVTVFGVLWIALGLGYLVLIREYALDPGASEPDKGRLAIFTVLLAVFA